jgi:cytochrome c biogenesis protein CcmG, thiol:disulfide interchange protein DsbE
MKRIAYIVPLAVFLVMGVYFAIGLQGDPQKLPSVLINQKVPEFSLSPIKGSTRGFSSDDLKGQVSLVNIFGSWCVACKIEHPFLMKIKREELVPVYGIDWNEKAPEAGPDWLEKFGNPYTLIGDDPRSLAAIAFGVTGAPETFLIDSSGVIRYKQIGPITPEIWEGTLWPLIEGLRKDPQFGKSS